MTVVQFPQREAIDVLWDRYQSLVRECIDKPSLWNDRAHQEALIRAHKRFSEAYIQEQGGGRVEAGR